MLDTKWSSALLKLSKKMKGQKKKKKKRKKAYK